jgi:hypothetical protein
MISLPDLHGDQSMSFRSRNEDKALDRSPSAVLPVHDQPIESYVPWFCLVFMLNLPFPFFMGTMVNAYQNTLVMVIGCVILLAIGCFICTRRKRIAFSLTVGGLVVALTQFAPFLQVMVGAVVVEGFGAATGLVESDEFGSSIRNGISTWACLIFTLLTGLILMGIALIVGEVIRLLLFRKKLTKERAENNFRF